MYFVFACRVVSCLLDFRLVQKAKCNYRFNFEPSGLAQEALEQGRLLWKTRPKYHKLLAWILLVGCGEG